LGESQIISVPIPHDCIDGFHGAFWRRPEAYLDPRVRSGISTYAAMSPDERDVGLVDLPRTFRAVPGRTSIATSLTSTSLISDIGSSSLSAAQTACPNRGASPP
jgi:hypothetical protein